MGMTYGMMMKLVIILRNWKKFLIWIGSGRRDACNSIRNHQIGYRDGLMAGKEASAQEGFNIGFKESVFVGQRWGLVRGVTSALVSLPEVLKQRLVETEDKRIKFQHLHESVRALSTKHMLKLFHDGLKDKFREQGENGQTSPPTEELHGQSSNENVLENYAREFSLLIQDSPGIKVHMENDL